MFKRLLLSLYRRVFIISQWMRLHFTRTGHLCLILLVMSGVFGVNTKLSNTYQLFVFLLVLFVIALLASVINRFKASITRQLPRYATVGEPLNYVVSLNNETKKAYTDLVYIENLHAVFPRYDEVINFHHKSHLPWYQQGVSFRVWRRYFYWQKGSYVEEYPIALIEVKNATQLKVSCTPLRRGVLNFSGAYIAKPDVLGLFRRLYFAPAAQRCLVLPKRYTVKPFDLSGKRQYQSGGVSLANSVGDSAEFMSLRDYRQGDALNQIHWKSFARHGKLIVKEYQDEYFVRRALLLDTDGAELAPEYFEAAVSVAASLAMTDTQNDALLDLMFVGRESYHFTAGRGVDHLPHLQEILAAVQTSDSESFSRLKIAVMEHLERCSSLVCVLLHWDTLRQDFFKLLSQQGMPLAIFLIHDGTVIKAELKNLPEHFYLINHQQLGNDLAHL